MIALPYPGRRWCVLMMVLTLAVANATSTAFASDIESDELRTVHEKAAVRFSAVRHISAKELEILRRQEPLAPLIFDVREKSEYAVSHLAGAVQIEPEITAADFLRKFSGRFRGRSVIVYCSVGVRSMRLAERIQVATRVAGAKATYNLAGGIFNWHNQSRPLESKAGPAEHVHPYNWIWSRLVTRRELISYKAAVPRVEVDKP